MSPVVANGCVTPEATTTWRCREVPVFGLCICGRKLCQRPTLTLKVTQNNNMMNSRRILGCTYDSDAWLFLHESRLPGFSSEEKSNLTSIDGWSLVASVIFLWNFVEATKCGAASGSAKARFSMFAWKTVWNQNQISSESEWRWVAFTTSGCYWCQAADCPLQSTWHQALTRHLQAFSYSL